MTRAIEIITDAYERCNRLSPGETLSADDAAFGFRRLNLLVDEMSGQNGFLFRSVLTSAAASGVITLGVGAWLAISPGDEVVSATANNLVLSPVTMRQYNEIYQPGVTGIPAVYAHDGLSTLYLWPVPTGQTIKLLTRSPIAQFADQATDYKLPDGYSSALGAALAVRIAPSVLGNIPAYLIRTESVLMGNINKYEPAIIDMASFTGARLVNPARLF